MTLISEDLPSIPLAFRAIAALTPSDSRMIFMAKEINLFIEVLQHQGQRSYLSPHDLKTLFARMTDLAHIAPLTPQPEQVKPGSPAQPPEIKLDLDQLETAVNRRLTPPKPFKGP